MRDNQALTIDRDARVDILTFNKEEYVFKLALFLKDTRRIKTLIAYIIKTSFVNYLKESKTIGKLFNCLSLQKELFCYCIESRHRH